MPDEILTGKKVLVGVTGSIAAYKACELVRLFRKANADVQVMMTANAAKMVGPDTMAALTGKPVFLEMFPEKVGGGLAHINLAETLDMVIVAPATANILAKAAHGIADDLLSTTLLVCEVPKIFAPAMNFRMWRHPATVENVSRLQDHGVTIVQPGVGYLASMAVGAGRMAEPEMVFSAALSRLDVAGKLKGVRVLVTAGPTQEPLDPVRFLSNRSSGKMGYALAEAAVAGGAEVTLVSGPTHLQAPDGARLVRVRTADEMSAAVRQVAAEQEVVIMAAAVADFKPTIVSEGKIKKDEAATTIQLERTPDILKGLRQITGALLIGFALETGDGEANARSKLEEKQLDAIILNWGDRPGSGFQTDDNQGVLFTKNPERRVDLALQSKASMANQIIDEISPLLESSREK